jgi:hypothetical protein
MCTYRIKYSSINNSDNDIDQPFVNALLRKKEWTSLYYTYDNNYSFTFSFSANRKYTVNALFFLKLNRDILTVLNYSHISSESDRKGIQKKKCGATRIYTK